MKKAVGIILVLVLVFSFATTSLAAEPPTDGPVGDPADKVAWDDSMNGGAGGTNPDLPVPGDFDIYPDNATGSEEAWVDPMYTEEGMESIKEDIAAIAETDSDAPKYDEVYEIGSFNVVGTDPAATVPVGGWIKFKNDEINYYDAVNIYKEWFDGTDWWYQFIYDVKYDTETGEWYFWTDDVETLAYYFALVERGVDPAVAAQIASSPKTADNGTSTNMMWVVLLMASVLAVAAVKKARQAA